MPQARNISSSFILGVETRHGASLLQFEQEKITLGSASRFLGITQLEFQALLTEKNLCIHYDVNELHEDVRNLQELGLL